MIVISNKGIYNVYSSYFVYILLWCVSLALSRHTCRHYCDFTINLPNSRGPGEILREMLKCGLERDLWENRFTPRLIYSLIWGSGNSRLMLYCDDNGNTCRKSEVETKLDPLGLPTKPTQITLHCVLTPNVGQRRASTPLQTSHGFSPITLKK